MRPAALLTPQNGELGRSHGSRWSLYEHLQMRPYCAELPYSPTKVIQMCIFVARVRTATWK